MAVGGAEGVDGVRVRVGVLLAAGGRPHRIRYMFHDGATWQSEIALSRGWAAGFELEAACLGIARALEHRDADRDR